MLRQVFSVAARRALGAGASRFAPAAVLATSTGTGVIDNAAAAWAAQSREVSFRAFSAEAVAEHDERLPEPETTGWGSTRVGQLLKSKADDSGAWLWCSAEDWVIDAIRKMTHANVGSLLVFDPSKMQLQRGKDGKVVNASRDAMVGIITERDYMTKVVIKGKQSSSTRVGEIMTPADKLMTVTPQHSVLDVMELMVEKNVRHLPVIDEGNMAGMVSIRDVVHVMLKEHREEVERMEEYIQGTY